MYAALMYAMASLNFAYGNAWVGCLCSAAAALWLVTDDDR